MKPFAVVQVATFVVVATLVSPPALAVAHRYDLASEQELTVDGWKFESSGGSRAFAGGLLTIDSNGFGEWLLNPDTRAEWFQSAANSGGWMVEARARLVTATGCVGPAGPGMWIHDGNNLIQFHLSATQAALTYPELHAVDLDTAVFHEYRVQSLGNRHVQLLVDGKLAIDVPRTTVGSGTLSLDFGDLGGCPTSKSEWDWFAYDTQAPQPLAGDADGDGKANAADNCQLLANAAQADQDRDGIGDACDPCPTDADNDADSDRLCAPDDPCPDDPRNDANQNQICDTLECTSQPPGVCLSFCGCVNNGFGGSFPLDNWGGFLGYDPVGGAVNSGGAANHAGAPVKAGSGSGGNSSGGSPGPAVTAGSDADAGAGADSSAGCGCKVPATPAGNGVFAVLLGLGLGYARQRRRAR